MTRQKKPTHAAVARLIASILPEKDNDVSRFYHTPRNPRYDPETAVVEQVVLSVAPTPGVYALIGEQHDETSTDVDAQHRPLIPPRPPRTTCFLHRPFTLDRRSVRRGTLVLSSHTSFDEVLTVGWNVALAERLGVNVGDSICVQGYKGDPERRIGLIGQVSMRRDVLRRRIQTEFADVEFVHDGLAEEIRVVAVMNAFNEVEVLRVLEAAQRQGWIPQEQNEPGKHIVYLTGQPRVDGFEAAKALGMTVVCVGHRQAEDWGIRFLAASVRKEFPGIHVEEMQQVQTQAV
ncbi:hypothetical protein IQ07DRAFT_594278 [Pyrenochaeta sp. DS3sAY3a]|nr:hypothetical protein IQ07DRAFT_594278 [Pyrenochaeta sp. DS3sAY3a]